MSDVWKDRDWTDEVLDNDMARYAKTDPYRVMEVHVGRWLELLRELKAARQEIAKLNGLLDWAYDGLDENWATLPENVERVRVVAELFAKKVD